MGIRDYFEQDALCLIEWPSQGEGFLPNADLELHLSYEDEGPESAFCYYFHKEGILFYPVFSLHKGILIMSSLITIVSQSQRYVVAFLLVVCLYFCANSTSRYCDRSESRKQHFSNNSHIYV